MGGPLSDFIKLLTLGQQMANPGLLGYYLTCRMNFSSFVYALRLSSSVRRLAYVFFRLFTFSKDIF